MKSEQIQTLHPVAGKTNKKISLEKYEFINSHLLAILSVQEPTHTELMEVLYFFALSTCFICLISSCSKYGDYVY